MDEPPSGTATNSKDVTEIKIIKSEVGMQEPELVVAEHVGVVIDQADPGDGQPSVSSGDPKRNLSLEALFKAAHSELESISKESPIAMKNVKLSEKGGDQNVSSSVASPSNTGATSSQSDSSPQPLFIMEGAKTSLKPAIDVLVTGDDGVTYELHTDEEGNHHLVYTTANPFGTTNEALTTSSILPAADEPLETLVAVEKTIPSAQAASRQNILPPPAIMSKVANSQHGLVENPTAATQGHLQGGRKRKHPQKPGKHVCPYCGRGCAKPSVLQKHIRAHTGERPYPCTTCGFAFKTKSNLYKHCKSRWHALRIGEDPPEGSQDDDRGGLLSQSGSMGSEDHGFLSQDDNLEDITDDEDLDESSSIAEQSQNEQNINERETESGSSVSDDTRIFANAKLEKIPACPMGTVLMRSLQGPAPKLKCVSSSESAADSTGDLPGVQQIEIKSVGLQSGGKVFERSTSFGNTNKLSFDVGQLGKTEEANSSSQIMPKGGLSTGVTDLNIPGSAILSSKISLTTTTSSEQSYTWTVMTSNILTLTSSGTLSEMTTRPAGSFLQSSGSVLQSMTRSDMLSLHQTQSMSGLQFDFRPKPSIGPQPAKSSPNLKTFTPEMLNERISKIISDNTRIVSTPMAEAPRPKRMTRQASEPQKQSSSQHPKVPVRASSFVAPGYESSQYQPLTKLASPVATQIPIVPKVALAQTLPTILPSTTTSKILPTCSQSTLTGMRPIMSKDFEQDVARSIGVLSQTTASMLPSTDKQPPGQSAGNVQLLLQTASAKPSTRHVLEKQRPVDAASPDTATRSTFINLPPGLLPASSQPQQIKIQFHLPKQQSQSADQTSGWLQDNQGIAKAPATDTAAIDTSPAKLQRLPLEEIPVKDFQSHSPREKVFKAEAESSEDKQSDVMYECAICSYSSTSLEVLKTHFISHTEQQPAEVNFAEASGSGSSTKSVLSLDATGRSSSATDRLTSQASVETQASSLTEPGVYTVIVDGTPQQAIVYQPVNKEMESQSLDPSDQGAPFHLGITPKRGRPKGSRNKTIAQKREISKEFASLDLSHVPKLGRDDTTDSVAPLDSIRVPSGLRRSLSTNDSYSKKQELVPSEADGQVDVPTCQALLKLRLKGKLLMKRSMSVERMLQSKQQHTEAEAPMTTTVTKKTSVSRLIIPASEKPGLLGCSQPLFSSPKHLLLQRSKSCEESSSEAPFMEKSETPSSRIGLTSIKHEKENRPLLGQGDAPCTMSSDSDVVLASKVGSTQPQDLKVIDHETPHAPVNEILMMYPPNKLLYSPLILQPNTCERANHEEIPKVLSIPMNLAHKVPGLLQEAKVSIKKEEPQSMESKSIMTSIEEVQSHGELDDVEKKDDLHLAAKQENQDDSESKDVVLGSSGTHKSAEPSSAGVHTIQAVQLTGLSPHLKDKARVALMLLGHSYPSLQVPSMATYCSLTKTQPMYVKQGTNHKISMYSTWRAASVNPNPMGISSKEILGLYQSQMYDCEPRFQVSAITKNRSGMLTHSSYWDSEKTSDSVGDNCYIPLSQHKKDHIRLIAIPDINLGTKSDICHITPNSRSAVEQKTTSVHATPIRSPGEEVSVKSESPTRIKLGFEGGYKSMEDYTYVRGRGFGRYVCEKCGIRCKKPSMLKKHIRTHTDIRPYHCRFCTFSFKTKGNLTKHMKSKAHHKVCMDLGIVPVPTMVDVNCINPEVLAQQSAVIYDTDAPAVGHTEEVTMGQEFMEVDEDDDDDDDEMKEVCEYLLGIKLCRQTLYFTLP